MADEILYTDWRTGDHPDARTAVRAVGMDVIQVVLLRDIAESLRILRCQNFKDIPQILRGIRIKLPTQNKRRKR